MRYRLGWRVLALGILAGDLAACGSGDSGPTQSPPVISKPATKSGDQQTGPVGQPLPVDLRVVITRDGNPEPDVTVNWTTSNGSLAPATDQTDANGESTSTWTLGTAAGSQSASASVQGGTGSPVTFTATATSTEPTGATVQVLGPGGGNRFDPAALTVLVGETVTWQWGVDAQSHNVVPDNGTTPATSGAVTNGPHDYQYTFTTAGVFHYHCASHGGNGGVGMSGTITVVTSQP